MPDHTPLAQALPGEGPEVPDGPLTAGQSVRLFHPRHAEHGARGIVAWVEPSGLVMTRQGWSLGRMVWFSPHPAVSEAEYQRLRAAARFGHFWPG